MVKSGQKRKKAEKAKTKLKTSLKGQKKSVRLGKGHNEVKFQLATKTLVVKGWKEFSEGLSPEERKRHMEEGQKRLRPMRDLITKIGQHTLASKQEGLRGLKDWVKFKQDEITTNLALVITKVMSLITDKEHSVRTELVEFFQLLLVVLPHSVTEAFSGSIIAHLCCALAHIDTAIQRDAFKFLDTLIDAAPGLVNIGYEKLLPACLGQASSKCVASASGAFSSGQLGSSESSNNSKDLHNGDWRHKVLQRLESIRKIMIKRQNEDTNPCVYSTEPKAYYSIYPPDRPSLTFAALASGNNDISVFSQFANREDDHGI